MKSAALFLALIATAATAAPDQDWKAAKPAGEAITCLPLANIRESRVRDDRTIDFYTRDGKVYRNTLPNICPRLGMERRFGYQTSLNRLCNVDIITVLLISPAPSASSCGLGNFQPVTGVPR